MNQKNYLEIIDQLSKENDELNNNLQKALDIIKEKINTDLNNKNYSLKVLKESLNQNKEKKYNIKALKVFDSIDEFNNFTENLYNVEYWQIYPDTYKNRAKQLNNTSYWVELKKIFETQKLINKEIGEEQLVSYFDTMNLMYYILSFINNQSIKNELKIIMEYRITTSEKERPDYLLIYRNEIIILEFGNAVSIEKTKKLKTEKLNQLNEYENNLKNTLSNKNISFTKIPVIYLPDNNDNFNKNLVKDIGLQINKILKENNYSAFQSILDTK